MKSWMIITTALLGLCYSLSASATPSCSFYPAIDGDLSISENVKGHPGADTYSYLVKRDLFGDGKTFVLYPVYSKNWLLTTGRLRELVSRDKANVIGSDDVPLKISVVQSPKDANDFKAIDDSHVCAPSPQANNSNLAL